jgi:putative tricarboxylic transport membrane protein
VTFLSPLIAGLAITFGPPEYATLMTLGLSMIMLLSTGSTSKAVISGIVGFLISTIGMDLFSGVARFTMGQYELLNGIDFIAVSIGLFAIAEVMVNLEASSDSRPFKAPPSRIRDLFPSKKDLRDSGPAIAQGTVVGFSVGVLPGVGSTVASFLSYSLAKRFSRHPEEYGRGAIGGVAAPESANNAATSAGFIPMLTLGIPAGGSMAILLGALFMYGLEPGPRFFASHPEVVWPIIASMYVGNVMLVILNLPMVPLFASLLRVPYRVLYPTIIVISLVGVYSVNNSVFDVLLCVIFGTLGYIMRKTGFPAPPLVLAFILGPMIEKALRQSLLISGGDMTIFVTRPWSAAFLAVLVLLIVVPLLMRNRTETLRLKEMIGEED